GGSNGVVVAVIDSGVDYTHPDLAPNMWVNAAEIPDNGIDDDGNGIVDDIHGADFLSNRSNHNGNPTDHNGHGTHCAGIIAAVADNDLGGVGVAYNSRIMAIKAAQYNGMLTSSDIAESIYYAVENGADVISMSFGGATPSPLTRDALEIAFGQAVLVASAGNSGKHNEAPRPNPLPNYPACWPFVIGVMAENTAPSDKGEWLAVFSNWDSNPGSRIEYEMMAPGVQIYSTLPEGKYAAWNGTSMAAPIAAGVAALVRTKFPEKNIYSSRFIMGQVASTGALKKGNKNSGPYPSLDGEAALTKSPTPKLSVIDYQVFDDPSFSDVNDGDGIVDSGETIELAVTIKNRWGKADPVTVTLAAQAAVAVGPDPFVTWDLDTVDYGAVGNFGEDDNGVIRDLEGLVTGVENPFRFTVSKDAFNNHIIPIKVSISAGNGFDAEDLNAPYDFSGSFNLVVQRGRIIPSVIEEDTTFTSEDYWIVDRPIFIPEGVTLTITKGAQFEFWSPEKLGVNPPPSFKVAGTLNVIGTEDEPVEFFNSALMANYTVDILKVRGTDGRINLSYFKINNPRLTQDQGSSDVRGALTADHGIVTFDYSGDSQDYYTWLFGKDRREPGEVLTGGTYRAVVFRNIGFIDSFFANYDTCLFDIPGRFLQNTHRHPWDISGGNTSFKNTTLLNPSRGRVDLSSDQLNFNWGEGNNAILNDYLNETPINGQNSLIWDGSQSSFGGDISNNYWGTTSLELINASILDKNIDFSFGDIVVEPILEVAPESCWPFVVDCVLSTELENDVSEVGGEVVTYTVTFNRDMDTSIQPKVYFGPDDPVTDFTILGDWQDARTWVGSFKINSITGDGYQQIRIQDAVAADDAWLASGRDIGRFRFEIVTSGTEALTLQASGGEGFVDLSWGQDDFELLAGYNLYRGDQRINSSIVPAGTTSF
ncbi:S8 family serine peptidase, partial [Akkermansiaceae bacterium]|nr:S8 family serine peptidase [Akkermansiaceae bacterium]